MMTEPVYEDAPAPPAGVDPIAALAAGFASLTDAQLDAIISDLTALRASRQATAQRTRVEHESGAAPEAGS